jgi:hypothetical protein
VHQLREQVLQKVQQLLEIELTGDPVADANTTESMLIRFQITLLRQITPEFLHYNIFLTQASNNAFQNMINHSGMQSGNQAQYNSGSGMSSS